MPESENRTRILLVEDDEGTRTLLEFLLRRGGFEVITANDGEQGLERITSIAPPHLILLDVMMPYRDGFEVLARIKSLPGWEAVPIVLLTACDSEEDIKKGLETGIAAYITKPFDIENLTRTLQGLIPAYR